MDNSTVDDEHLKCSLEIFCRAIHTTTPENYAAWKQIALMTLELLEELPNHFIHFKFHLSQIAYTLVTRLISPLQGFPRPCPIALKLLRTLTKYEIDQPTFHITADFLSNPEKYYLKINEENPQPIQNELNEQTNSLFDAPNIFINNQQDTRFPPSAQVQPSIRRKYSDYYSLCVLDLAGNFLLCDENSRKIFGRPQNKLKGKNLFRDLMIPFSLAALRKKYGGDVFKLFDDKLSSVFSFTIYSSDNIDKYTKELVAKCQDPLRKNLSGEDFTKKKDRVELFMSNLMKQLADESSDAIYFKFLQNLTSKASLIDLQMTQTEIKELLSENSGELDVGVVAGSVLQEFLAPSPGLGNQIIRTVILLETRKAKHIQNFPYHLMTQDPKITYWLSK